MDDLFDTAAGLPLHALVVHAVVAGIPVMALVTAAVASRDAWRRSLSWFVVVANAGLLALTFVTVRSGEALRARRESLAGAEIPSITRHADRGGLMPWFVAALLAVSVLVAATRHRPALRLPGLVLALLVAAAAIWWTVLTGHSGSASVWGDLIRSNSG